MLVRVVISPFSVIFWFLSQTAHTYLTAVLIPQPVLQKTCQLGSDLFFPKITHLYVPAFLSTNDFFKILFSDLYFLYISKKAVERTTSKLDHCLSGRGNGIILKWLSYRNSKTFKKIQHLLACFCLFLELWNIHDFQSFDLYFEERHNFASKLSCQYFHFTPLYRSS